MDKRLKNLLAKGVIVNGILDTYNQRAYADIAPTITTRVNASNNIYVSEMTNTELTIDDTYCVELSDHKKLAPLRIKEATVKGYAEAHEGDSVNLAVPNSQTRRGRVGNQIANTLDTGCQQGVVVVDGVAYRIRKLTPRECFRLMGVDDADIDKIQAAGISNTQQYKMAGNSIVVDNLFYIFRNLFIY